MKKLSKPSPQVLYQASQNSQPKVIWVDFVKKQRIAQTCTGSLIAANRSCFLLRRKS